MFIPTEKQLASKVKLVEVTVKGGYIARIDEKRKTKRNYEVKVLLPENFTMSDVKRLTPRALAEQKEDYVTMLTFSHDGKAKKTDKTIVLRELYNENHLRRFAKARQDIVQEKRKEIAERQAVGDDQEYDEKTGLPYFVN